MFCAESTIHYSLGLVALGKDKQHAFALNERLNKTKEYIIVRVFCVPRPEIFGFRGKKIANYKYYNTRKNMININSRILFYIIFCMIAGGTAHSSQPIPIGATIFCYFTKDKVLIDAECGTKEWMACKRSSSIRYKVGKNSYNRHNVRCMYDADWFYLSINTSYNTNFGVKRYPVFLSDFVTLSSNSFLIKEHKEPTDNFNLKILSDSTFVLCVNIFSDGLAYQWPFSNASPKKIDVQNYVRREYDITVAAVSTNYANGNIRWHSEIKLPLKKLQPLGRKLIFNISGAKGRMKFYPNKQSITRSFDEL